MVVPDFELICEIMLVAEGFQEARILARKFITLYTLCKELLSKQDHYDWGLRAIKFVTSWIETRTSSSERSNLVLLFDKYIPPCLEATRSGRFRKVTPLTDISHTHTLCHLLDCLLTEENTPADCAKELQEAFFVFSCVWAFGAPIIMDQMVDYRLEFSKWWVSEFKAIKFPPQGTVFDYYIDPESKQFVPWTERLPKFELDPDIPLQVKGAGMVDTRENCWKFFIDRVRRQLRVVLCFSPVGSTLRIRSRKFPALVNCTAVNWFHEWPQEALVSVSKRFLQELEILPVT
ncbi:hypothetical protein J437_LFUL019610 [Ladona fulva]|uniref:Dynein heavy chain n=1 Tax=Ladona fulva TaxID=123851 RepID=A0A8K0KSH9_LADFU|nr:hypothetical protein J437_LFUL019610 [Ladona fulva]